MSVRFDETSHTYTSEKGDTLISVTTLLKKYVPPFDAHYWSTYKAIKEVLEKKGIWAQYKQECGGWENVVPVTRNDKTFAHRAEVMEVKKRLLREWDDNAREAASKGTRFHKMKESTDRSAGTVRHEKLDLPVHPGDSFRSREFDSKDGVFPELLVFDLKLGIAGTADWVVKNAGIVTIKDYKTSGKIPREGFQGETLLYPLEKFPNAKFYIYALQLSLYAYIIQRRGDYKIGGLSIEHVDPSTGEILAVMPVEYYKDDIERLLKHWIDEKKSKK